MTNQANMERVSFPFKWLLHFIVGTIPKQPFKGEGNALHVGLIGHFVLKNA